MDYGVKCKHRVQGKEDNSCSHGGNLSKEGSCKKEACPIRYKEGEPRR